MFIAKFLLRCIFVVTLLASAAFSGALIYLYNNQHIDFSSLITCKHGTPSVLLDEKGNEWAKFQLDWREPIALQELPQHLIDAFIAAEDWAFFTHNGISIKGIIRSLCVNIYKGYKAQGASTITQQLIRLLFFDTSKTFTRKIKEQLLALVLEKNYTKEEILETYLNHVYFGCGIYGVQAAAHRFWGKSARDLTIDESATLAGIMKSPARYNPLLQPIGAQKRRNNVLALMYKLTFIDDATYAATKQLDLHLKTESIATCAPHLKEQIRLFLEELVGKKMLYTGGMTIQTTINKTLQHAAQNAFLKQCTHLKKTIHPSLDGGLITIDAHTGAIRALIGGYNFKMSKWNRATQARRQIGSTFKPLLYACALATGNVTFADTEIDEPIELIQATSTWKPVNYHGKFEGEMTLARALSHSNNSIAIKTLLNIGYDPVIKLARQCGITAAMPPFPSLALGCIDTTVQEVVGMFNVFANAGTYVEPHALVWIKDNFGKKIWRYTPRQRQAICPSVASHVAKVLELGIHRVRHTIPGAWIDTAVISKTGTTNDSRSCWFIGATPDYTTALYIGRDDNKPLGVNIFPIKTAFPIWLDLHQTLPIKHKQFLHDPLLKIIYINEWTGQEVAGRDGDGKALPIFAPFKKRATQDAHSIKL